MDNSYQQSRLYNSTSCRSSMNLASLSESFIDIDSQKKLKSVPSEMLNEKRSLVKQIDKAAQQKWTEQMNNSILVHAQYKKLVINSNRTLKSKPTRRKLVKRQSVIERDIQKNSFLKGMWRELPVSWAPPFREFATMAELGRDLYLLGGMGNSIYSDFYKYDSYQDKWAILPKVQQRYGHTHTESNGALYLIGGEYQYPSTKAKLLHADIQKFDGEEWSIMKYQGVYQPRKFHCVTIYSHYLLITGGEAQKNKLISDVQMLDVSSGKCLQTFALPKPIKYHAAISANELVYVYGGVDQAGEVLGDLYTFDHFDGWNKITAFGQAPPKVCMHSLLYFDPFIILYGGKNEERFTQYLTNIYLLDKQNQWIQMPQDGPIPKGRAAHSAVIQDDTMIIFGGFNLDGYLSNQVQIIDFHRVMQIQTTLTLPEIKMSPIKQAKMSPIKFQFKQ